MDNTRGWMMDRGVYRAGRMGQGHIYRGKDGHMNILPIKVFKKYMHSLG